MTTKVRILQFLTTFTQMTARLKTFLRDWLLFLGLKEGLVECATVCFILDFLIISRPICFALNFFLLLLVGDIPSYTDNFAGTRAIASFDEKGAYLQNDEFFFQIIVRFKFLFVESDDSKVVSGSLWHRTYAFTS